MNNQTMNTTKNVFPCLTQLTETQMETLLTRFHLYETKIYPTIKHAIKRDRLDLVQFYVERNPSYTLLEKEKYIKKAIKVGSLDIIRYFEELKWISKYTKQMVILAIRARSLIVLSYILSKPHELPNDLFAIAAQEGNIIVFQFLQSKILDTRYYINEHVLRTAFRTKNKEMIEYLLSIYMGHKKRVVRLRELIA